MEAVVLRANSPVITAPLKALLLFLHTVRKESNLALEVPEMFTGLVTLLLVR